MSAIHRTTVSYDIPKQMFLQFNSEIENWINNGDLATLPRPFQILSRLSSAGQARYLSEGSYYSALSSAMQKGDFQKVADAIDALKTYPQFETEKIKLCRIACSLQLDEADLEKVSALRKIGTVVEEMIKSSTGDERQAYENLRAIIQPSRSSPI